MRLPFKADSVYARFYPYFRKYVKLLVLSLLLSTLVSGAGAAFPWFLRLVVDKLFVQKEISQFLPIVAALAAIMLASQCCYFLQSYFMEKVRLDLGIHLRIELLKSVLRKKPGFFRDRHTGQIMSLFNNDLRLAEGIPDMLARLFVEFPIRMLALLGTMFYLNFKLALFVSAAAPLVYFILSRARKFRRRLSTDKMNTMARIYSDFQEFIAGIKLIKAWNLFAYCGDKFSQDQVSYRNQSLREVKYNALLRGGLSVVTVLIISVVLYLAILQMRAEGTTPGDYAGFVLALYLFLEPLKMAGMGYSSLVNAGVAAERVLGVLDSREDDEVNLEGGQGIGTISKIEVRGATYDYDGRPILKEVNATFEASKVYALVGPNGAGKTTLVESLVGFVSPSSGQVLVNGRPLQEYNLSAIRSRAALVWQQVLFFNISIRENIALNAGAADAGADARYRRALDMALVNDFLAERGRDDSATVAERGDNFSAGEKQRMCIARALFKDHDLLILDESNANIAKDVFVKIMASISGSKDGKIIIFITHDPDYLRYADVVYQVADSTVTTLTT